MSLRIKFAPKLRLVAQMKKRIDMLTRNPYPNAFFHTWAELQLLNRFKSNFAH